MNYPPTATAWADFAASGRNDGTTNVALHEKLIGVDQNNPA
jgi:hypothetical protein